MKQQAIICVDDDQIILSSLGEQLSEQNQLLKATNEQLEQSLSLLLATLEATADGILVLDNLGKVVRSNQKFRDLWEISEEIATELDTKKILNMALWQLAEADNSELQARQTRFEPSNHSLVKLENGKVLECYCQVQQLQNRQIGRVWSFRDVTQRQKTEAIVKHQAKDRLTLDF
jgi:PAS domain S-box-containing protein